MFEFVTVLYKATSHCFGIIAKLICRLHSISGSQQIAAEIVLMLFSVTNRMISYSLGYRGVIIHSLADEIVDSFCS